MSVDTLVKAKPVPGRRWYRRKPVRRAMVLVHRWTSLVLGLLLVIETTTGVVLLYRAEYFRSTHAELYRHTASAQPIGLRQAFETVQAAHPDFGASWVSNDGGVIAVGDKAFAHIYTVDPGTGQINGPADITDGVMGVLTNIHDCGLSCPAYSGYQAWLATPVLGMTWGALILLTLGLLMILLAITGLITWWPGIRKFSHGWRVRLKKGRFARDTDLHNVIGMVALPFLFMWGVTGAALELPQVEDVWLTITGGSPVDPDKYAFTANPGTGADIGMDRAVSAALHQHAGDVRYLMMPTEATPYYSVSIASEYAPFGERGFFGGDAFIYVDARDAGHLSVVDGRNDPAANRFYDSVFEPAHFGWLVGGWWRIIWVIMGLTPLALMITGLSTWLYRTGVQRRRKARA
ncbi:PepSY domain-containing protein [Pseudonocardiaceae bacterium YIM PH 21723]|nr:PepSY domain-containing protein [Pseudonocardiaceae bacterium YIM PH 21723]